MKKIFKLSLAAATALFLVACGGDDNDVTNAVTLSKVGDLNVSQSTDDLTEATAEDMALSNDGKTVYLADGSAGLKVINVEDPANPTLLAHYDDPTDAGTNKGGFARRITISPDAKTIYMADGLAGLKVIDVSDPSSPTLLGKYDTKGFSHGVTVSADNKTVYVSDNGEDGGTPGLRVIDVSDPQNPTLITERNEQWATQVALSADGKKVFITDKKAGILVADTEKLVSSANNPLELIKATLGKYTVTDKGISADIVLSSDGTKAYVANKKPGIKILNIADPANPTLLGKFDADGFGGKSIAKSIALSKDEKRLYVANRSTGVEVIDVSNAESPKQLATLDTASAEDVMLSKDGKTLYVADGKSGFKVISIK